jgi:hypothetical protein
LQIAFVCQVPCVLWFKPMAQNEVTSGDSPIHFAAVQMSRSRKPVISATRASG